MKNYFLSILTSIAITQGVYSQTEKPPTNGSYILITTFLLHINGQDSTGVITITKNGTFLETINSTGIIYREALDLNSNYLFKFTKPGYITKSVLINTKVPELREYQEFALFKCIVELFKEDGKTKPYQKPVGEIKYSKEKLDFDYNKNYN